MNGTTLLPVTALAIYLNRILLFFYCFFTGAVFFRSLEIDWLQPTFYVEVTVRDALVNNEPNEQKETLPSTLRL